MSAAGPNVNVNDEQLSEIIKNLNQTGGFQAETERTYYVLAETTDGNESRVVLKDLKTQLPLDDLRRKKPDYQNKKNLYVDVDGSFFPDLIETNGLFLTSELFLATLRNTVHLREKYIYNYIGLCAEQNQRIETYCLLLPPQLDCILAGSVRYDKNHCLTYFEIDEAKTGKAEIFRVKDFPHLIVTAPVSRNNGAGFECTSLENFFDYAEVRDRDYQERLGGQQLTAALQEYERRVMASENYQYKHGLTAITELRPIRQEVATGLRKVFAAYQGPAFPSAELSGRRLTFYCSEADGKIALTDATGFSETEFQITFLPKALAYLETVPDVLKTIGHRLVRETVLSALIQECRCFESYANIHGNQRFRLYLGSDFEKTTNPPLIYDYQPPTQRSIKDMFDFHRFIWNGKDLREYDFSGQNLSGLKITGANLANAKFNGCGLNNTEFSDCNLFGAQFKQAKLQGAKFHHCELDRTNFDAADLQKAELIGSNLFQCSFVKTNLTDTLVKNLKLSKVYFYRAKLTRTRFRIRMTLFDVVFRLCDLRSAQFNGDVRRNVNIMSGCDFSNSDLSSCQFAFNRISKTNFTKAKLIEADFSQCHSIGSCNFKGTTCAAMNLEGLQLSECNFTKVDLSMLKPKSGAIFVKNNNFTYANLSGYDFSLVGCRFNNNFTNANLSGCNLEYTDLTESNLLNTNLNATNLDNATLTLEQLKWLNLSTKQHNEIVIIDENNIDEF